MRQEFVCVGTVTDPKGFECPICKDCQGPNCTISLSGPGDMCEYVLIRCLARNIFAYFDRVGE